MTYVKIHEDMILDGVDADRLLEQDIDAGTCFYGNRDFGFIGNEQMKEIYENILNVVDDDTEIDDLEYYFNIDSAKAEEVHNILYTYYNQKSIHNQGSIHSNEVFWYIAQAVTGKHYVMTTLRGSSQSDWTYCLYVGNPDKDYEDFLNAVFWGVGCWIECSDTPTFEYSYWDYVTIPYPDMSEIESWVKANIDSEYKIVDEDDDYSWWDDYHDDTQWDNTDYDFESVRRKPIKEFYDDDDDRGGYSDYERGYEDGYADGYEAGKQSTAKLYGEGCGNKKSNKKKDTKEEVKEDLVNGHRITGDDEIKEIYLFKYPDDELGEEINDGVTLNLLWNALNDGEDIYDIIGVADSTIRERIFLMLSKCFNVKYSDIYDLWLDPIMAKNLYKSFTQGYLSADEYNDAISKLGIPEQMRDTFLDELS